MKSIWIKYAEDCFCYGFPNSYNTLKVYAEFILFEEDEDEEDDKITKKWRLYDNTCNPYYNGEFRYYKNKNIISEDSIKSIVGEVWKDFENWNNERIIKHIL